jgi:uncharacterized repeat protein (TIGR03806 family)
MGPMQRRVDAVLAWVLLGPACGDAPADPESEGTDSTGPVAQTTGGDDGGPVLPPRPDGVTCRFDGTAPGLLPQLVAESTLAELGTGAVDVAADADTIYVATTDGRIVGFPSGGGPGTEVLDLDAQASRLISIAVAPDHAATGHLYVRYEASAGAGRSVVARYTVDPESGVAPASSAKLVLELADVVGELSGGALVFGPDTFLYIGVGALADGGTAALATDPTSRLGKLLRIDVSTIDANGTYAAPADNPFVGQGGASDEVWAVGLRDPWRCVFAPGDPQPWCVDVGATEQEIDHVAARADLGWPRVDGTACLLPGGNCSDLLIDPPYATYRSVDGDCGIAGVVWGAAELEGVLLYPDRCSGRIRGVDTNSGESLIQDEILGVLEVAPSALAQTIDGRILALSPAGVVELGVAPQTHEFPTRLSDAGCFDDLATSTPSAGVVPYGVNAPLWSDDAAKHRFMVVPPGQDIAVDSAGKLDFPVGTIVLKIFAFDFVVGDPSTERSVEARVMVRREFGWQFHSYRFDADGADATLVPGGERQTLELDDGGIPVAFEYDWPSRGNCKVCHGLGASDVLGLRLDQLDGEFDYGVGVGNQLDALQSIGMFAGPLPPVQAMVAYDDPDADLEHRARAYLHTNCGHCHRPGGWTPADLTMDLRYETPLADAQVCDVATQYYNAWVTSEIRIAPGDPDGSVIWQRIGLRGLGQMPPLATSRVDPGRDVVGQWIASLPGCP